MAWTTAYIGYTLTFIALPEDNEVFEKAANALYQLKTKKGWGYNNEASSDADSTAWVWRFFSRLGVNELGDITPESTLKQYLCDNFSARTFPSKDQFGTWAVQHDEVTPLVGVSLFETEPISMLIEKIRKAVIESWHKNRSWMPFWWTDDAYAWAKNLEFLKVSGGIPDNIFSVGQQWLTNKTLFVENTFDIAQLLTCSIFLDSHDVLEQALIKIEQMQLEDGSWPSSKTLVVPGQKDEREEREVFSDTQSIMSTGSALLALCLLHQYLITPKDPNI